MDQSRVIHLCGKVILGDVCTVNSHCGGHHPVERILLVESVPFVRRQVTEEYQDNLYCSRSSLERRRVQSPHEEKRYTTYSTCGYSARVIA
jgi:hypothetical protein